MGLDTTMRICVTRGKDGEPAEGLLWYKSAAPYGRVTIQILENGVWRDVEVTEIEES